MTEEHHNLHDSLIERLPRTSKAKPALCLGAYRGIEVQVLRELGWNAWGIDIAPPVNSRFVVYGDFHDLQLPSSSFDLVYSNNAKHSTHPDKFIEEIRRVLSPHGQLILEVELLCRDCWWNDIGLLETFIKTYNFDLVKSSCFDYPFRGQQLIFN